MKRTATILMAALAIVAAGFAACSDKEGSDPQQSDPQQSRPAVQDTTRLSFSAHGVSFDMVLVRGGSFRMGANDGDFLAYDKEKPAHDVTLTRDFYLGTTEVPQALYAAVMGSNPSQHRLGDAYPVEQVSYTDALEFCSRLSGLTGRTFTLPTEAQWEYAARGGHQSPAGAQRFAGGDGIDSLAWYGGNAGGQPHPVAQKTPNALGLYDMNGNVWEWCLDWYGGYADESQTDPAGPSEGSGRVRRGGSWGCVAKDVRTTYRHYLGADASDPQLGFRVAMLP